MTETTDDNDPSRSQQPQDHDALQDTERSRAQYLALNHAAAEATKSVTRLVVVKDGAYLEYWADHWSVDVQDDGRTLKLFARGDGSAAIETRATEFGELLEVSTEAIKEFTAQVAAAEGQPDRFNTNDLRNSKGESAPDDDHPHWGGKEACAGEIAALSKLGIQFDCRHKRT